MKKLMKNNSVGFFIKAVIGFIATALAIPVSAGTVALAQAPLANSTTTQVLPNLMFILDDSGSMSFTYLPDAADSKFSNNCYRNSHFNRLYYDPSVTYTVPVDATGAGFPASSFAAAPYDGFNSNDGPNGNGGNNKINLGTGFRADYFVPYSANSTYGGGTDNNSTSQAAYYYKYTAASPSSPVDGSCYSDSSYTKVVVSATSGPGASDERTNFANWFTYYRSRLLMMKTAASQSFKNIGNNFRVGYLTIDNNTGSDFLNIGTFDSTQKAAWYGKLFASTPNNGTPLRSALSAAGLLYSGQLNGLTLNGSVVTDPMQYSCQQNFAILSTDGYWNTRNVEPGCSGRNGAGCKLNRTSAVGEQDGSGTSRPLFDGQLTTTTASTPTTTVQRQQSVTTTTTTKVWRQYLYSTSTSGCSGGKSKVWQQEQQRTETIVTTTTNVNDVTSTTTRTVVTVNGVVTSDTTAGPSQSSAPVSSNTVTGSDTYTAWANNGASTVYNNSCKSSPSVPSSPSAATLVSTSSSNSGPVTTVLSTTGPTVGTTTTTAPSISGGSKDTLADVAMYYYQTDLRDTTLTNCTGALGGDVCENNVPGTGADNNTQQHMTTFTLGLGVDGTLAYSSTYPTDTSGDFYQIKTGSKDWPVPLADDPTAVDDLWHAAVDGRGFYFSAKNAATLVSSLNAALSGVSARQGFGTAAATSNLAPVAGDNYIFVASYTTTDWVGNVQAQTVDVSTGDISTSSAWCVVDIVADPKTGTSACTGALKGQVTASSDTRNIYTFISTGSTHLRSFAWGNLTSGEQALFNPNQLSQWSSTYTSSDKTAATGASLVNFLRGQWGNENKSGNTNLLYRHRLLTTAGVETPFGDVVDSQPVYMKGAFFSYTDPGYGDFATAKQSRAATVFVGSNDGMLHAFDASSGSTGTERWAYIPTPVMPNMYWLADFNYASNHKFYVNGTPSVVDVCVSSCTDATTADWRTILVGGLGGGGRGYYALDVTDPTAPKALWEFTSTNDSDLGFTFGNPVAAKQSDGTWVILVTSGYNNVSPGTGKGFLYVLNPLTGAVIRKIDTGAGSTATPNGLSKIAAWAEDPVHNASALYVYGGDLLGNVWRFDINTGDALKIATLKDASGNGQPITTRPELAKINGSRVIYVATGKYLELSDLTNTQVQSVYGFKDDGSTLADPRGALVQQTLVNTTVSGVQYRTVSNQKSVDFSTNRGWYADFPDTGERDNVDMLLLLGTLLVPTNVPTNGVCESGGYSWLNYFNYLNGGVVPGATYAGQKMGNDLTTGLNVMWINGKPTGYRTGSNSAPQKIPTIPFGGAGAGGVVGHRVSWRELIQQ